MKLIILAMSPVLDLETRADGVPEFSVRNVTSISRPERSTKLEKILAEEPLISMENSDKSLQTTSDMLDWASIDRLNLDE